jgi:hypothetical protein
MPGPSPARSQLKGPGDEVAVCQTQLCYKAIVIVVVINFAMPIIITKIIGE